MWRPARVCGTEKPVRHANIRFHYKFTHSVLINTRPHTHTLITTQKPWALFGRMTQRAVACGFNLCDSRCALWIGFIAAFSGNDGFPFYFFFTGCQRISGWEKHGSRFPSSRCRFFVSSGLEVKQRDERTDEDLLDPICWILVDVLFSMG